MRAVVRATFVLFVSLVSVWGAEIAHVQEARPETGRHAGPTPDAWLDLTRAQLVDQFPETLEVFPSIEGADEQAAFTFKRILSRTDLAPAALAAATRQDRIAVLRGAIADYASKTVEQSQARADGETAAQTLSRMSQTLFRLRELESLRGALDPEAARGVRRARDQLERDVQDRFDKLIADEAAKMSDRRKDIEWQGRTAYWKMEDGSVLAFKTGEANDLQNERNGMRLAAGLGLRAPVALDAGFRSDVPGVNKSRKAKGNLALPYLLPADLASDYRTYLNERLSPAMSEEQKAAVLRDATRHAVDDMIVLRRNGYAHESLTAITHNGKSWEWDYWRWVWAAFGQMRFGPSSISLWKFALRYPNLRMSGLADYEHLMPLSKFRQTHKHDNHGKVEHDAYSLGVGKNLTELALVLLHAAYANELYDDQYAALVWDALKRYAPGVSWTEAETSSMLQSLRSTSRRVQLTESMRGWMLQPLIMDVLKPYVARLREASVLDAPALGHPVEHSNPIWAIIAGWGMNLVLIGYGGLALLTTLEKHAVFLPSVSILYLGVLAVLVWPAGLGFWFLRRRWAKRSV